MAQVINTNILSLNAQRNLTNSQSALQVSLQRLSTGLRINSAKDDAAGLAISERFTTQIRGLNQAVRNANDGISLAQTAEGALGELNNNLQRIRELAVQSANATNSSSDRIALDREVQQRLAEIDRIASQTSFNGQKILDGTFGEAKFQVGANVGETIDLNLETSMRRGDLGAVATATSADLSGVISEGQDAVTGSAATYTFDVNDVVGTDYSTVPATATDSSISGAYTQAASDNAADAFQFSIDGVVVSDRLVGDATAANLDTDIAAFVGASGGAYTQTGTVAGGDLVISKADGTDLTLATSFSDGVGSSDPAAGNTSDGTFATAGFIGTHTGGTPEDTSANSTLAITDTDGAVINVALTTDLTADDGTALAALINAELGGEFTVALDTTAGTITFTDEANNAGSFSASLGGSALTPTASEAGVADQAAVPAASVTVADNFSIQIGDADAVSVENGEYTSVQALVDAMNTAMGGEAQAQINDDGTVSIIASTDITIDGSVGLTDLGFAATSEADGSLTTVNVLTVDAANDAIYRIDSALTAVSDLRSTFGAIQNRFESTINNLSATTENLEASRSRIRDADFAAETADLTRAQILQQAGISVLAQANAVPQSVLALLQ